MVKMTRKARKLYRDNGYQSPHKSRHCVICGTVTIWEIRRKGSFCVKCFTVYNKQGSKIVKRGDLHDTTVEIKDLGEAVYS